MLTNLFTDLEHRQDDELVALLAKGRDVRIERIVSHGQVSPEGFWYEQAESEWVVLLRGKAQIEFEGNNFVDLSAGDTLLIPALKRHRVTYTDRNNPSVWLAVFFNE